MTHEPYLGIIGGTGLEDLGLPEGTPDVAFLNRHDGNTPPHLINHVGNMRAFKNAAVTHVIGVTACGSLARYHR